MPLYDFSCGTCNRTVAEFRAVDDRDLTPERACLCGSRKWRRLMPITTSRIDDDLERISPAKHEARMMHKRETEKYIARHGGEKNLKELTNKGPKRYHIEPPK